MRWSTDAEEFQVTALSAGVEDARPLERDVDVVTLGAADPGATGGVLSDVYVVLRTSPGVASLELAVAADTYDSETADGSGLFWLPDGVVTQADLDRATVTALDADGNVLSRSREGELW